MKLVEKNSPAFVRANAKVAERAEAIEGLKAEISSLEVELSGLGRKIEAATLDREARSVREVKAAAEAEAAAAIAKAAEPPAVVASIEPAAVADIPPAAVDADAAAKIERLKSALAAARAELATKEPGSAFYGNLVQSIADMAHQLHATGHREVIEPTTAAPASIARALPPAIQRRVTAAVESLGLSAKDLDLARGLDKTHGGGGRYEADAFGNIGAGIDQDLAYLDQFRQQSAKNGFDADGFIAGLGGIPDGLEMSAAAQAWKEATSKPESTPVVVGDENAMSLGTAQSFLTANNGDAQQMADARAVAARWERIRKEQGKAKATGAAPADALKAWQKNPDADPAGGAQIIESWDGAKASAAFGAAGESGATAVDSFVLNHLQGRIVKTKAGDCIINSMSRGKLTSMASHPLNKLLVLAVPHIPNILIEGDASGVESLRDVVSNKIDRTSTSGFVTFTHKLSAGAFVLLASVKAGVRQAAPHLVYSINAKEIGSEIAHLNAISSEGSAGSSGADVSILDGASGFVNDDLNIEILEAWDADGNPIDLGAPEAPPEPTPAGGDMFGGAIDAPAMAFGDYLKAGRLSDAVEMLANAATAGKAPSPP